MKVTVAKRQGDGCEAVAERSRRQNPDRRNTNWQRGRAWAISVLANAKSEVHQDTSSIASRRGRKGEVITQGELFDESRREVSRGRSSVEACRKTGGAKGRRNHRQSSMEHCAAGKNPPRRQQTVVRKHEALREPSGPERCSRRGSKWGEANLRRA